MGIYTIGFVPLASFPFPYKYIIGVSFYFYLKHQISNKEKVINKLEYLLFVPAIIYGFMRLYWYVKLHTGIDKDIFFKVYQTGFFVYNDMVYLLFNLILIIIGLKFLKSHNNKIKGSISIQNNWKWLSIFSRIWMAIVILNLLHQVIANLFSLEHSQTFYYGILVLNSIYIYWIGFIGFTKSNLLFKIYYLKDQIEEEEHDSLKNRIEYYMKKEEVFTNRNFKVADLASLLPISEKELSEYIHTTYQMSFTDFINSYRVEKVKELLISSDQDKFTLLAVSEKAGFSSKSSFNAVFKKVTGLTPTQYKKEHQN
ncbi:helix-turn-helix domain-containing protein [Aquimarina litoralis]|uniref:helix-turn-helix domain-containing protein n=1 Tax=Aquimarina litoralis TaxID=584605 RepID=UPI001C5873C4|nr:helix-turn-helix domain-containing protein [Aquimarina litoralis]